MSTETAEIIEQVCSPHVRPQGWKEFELRELLATKPSYGANASAIDYVHSVTPRYVRITDITPTGRLSQDHIVGIEPLLAQRSILQKGDFLIARTGATVGKSYFYDESQGWCAYAGYLIKFVVDESKCRREFIRQILDSPMYWKWVRDIARTGAQPNINSEEYQSLLIPIPPLPEQSKIAEILGCWDKAIELMETLLVEKAILKSGLMQQLLAGLIRFGAGSSDHIFSKGSFGRYAAQWKMRKLSSFLMPTARPVPKPTEPYRRLGLRNRGQGTFITIAEPEKIAMDTLFEVVPNELIVNITFAWEGSITITKDSDAGALVSHRFPTFQFREDIMIGDYFKYLSMMPRFVYHLGLVSQGGAGRNRVLSKRDFLNLEIPVPSIEEQRKIASLLCSADSEIVALQNYLSETKAQKRGLMQRLLTGKIRVKV